MKSSKDKLSKAMLICAMAWATSASAANYKASASLQQEHNRAECAVDGDQSTVTDLFTPYLIPQENGAHCDVRWLKLSSANQSAPLIQVESTTPFIFSAQHVDAANLDAAIRNIFVKKRNDTILCIDNQMSGLGNASCGPFTLEKYRIKVKPYEFDFTIRIQ